MDIGFVRQGKKLKYECQRACGQSFGMPRMNPDTYQGRQNVFSLSWQDLPTSSDEAHLWNLTRLTREMKKVERRRP